MHPREKRHSSRHRRFLAILKKICVLDIFQFEQIQEICRPESPAFIRRLLDELVVQGWLLSEQSDSRNFFWNPERGTFSIDRWLEEKLQGNQIRESPLRESPLRESPPGERPRERLLGFGPANLSLSELFAILIRSGRPGESAVIAGQKLAREFDSRLGQLPNAGRVELKSISIAVDKAAYCQIMAGIELGRRIIDQVEVQRPIRIQSSSDAVQFCTSQYSRLIHDGQQEEFHIVSLGTKNQVIDCHQITVGTLDASLVHPREVFRPAIKDAASSVLLVHNHPSGDPTPSKEDIRVTRRLESAGELIGIDVLDHIILGHPVSVSLRELES